MRLLKRNNKKKKSYFKYLGMLFIILGISLILAAAFIFVSPYVFKKPLISPLPKNIKSQRQDIKSFLAKEKINISSFSIGTDSSYMITLSDGGSVVLSSRKDILTQLRSLQIILSRLTIEGKKLKSLDFRFDKPVLSF